MQEKEQPVAKGKTGILGRVGGGLSRVFKTRNSLRRTVEPMKRKIRLFLLQSMQTPPGLVDKEVEVLSQYYLEAGEKALYTRLRISYGGEFGEINNLSSDQVEKLLLEREGTEETFVRRPGKPSVGTKSFTNIYSELTFFRKPDVKFRFNKI